METWNSKLRCSTSSTTKKYQIQTQADNGVFIEIKLLSGRSNNFKYFVYVLIDESKTGLQAIIAHVCGCEVGERVAGCCSRVATRSPGTLDLLESKTSTDTSAEFAKNYFADGPIHIRRR